MPWIGVDFDGTLVQHDQVMSDPLSVGFPVPLMLQRVRGWVRDGIDVRVVTARVNSEDNPYAEKQRAIVDKWLKKYVGQALPITCKKSHSMIELWDDRAVQVIPNIGERVLNLDGQLLATSPDELHCSLHEFHMSGCSECYNKSILASYIRNESLEKLAPRVAIHPLVIDPNTPSPKIQLIRNQLTRKIYIFFQNSSSDIATSLRKLYLSKADKKEKKEAFAVAWAAIAWNELKDQIYSDLYEIAKISAYDGASQLEVQEDVEALAEKYAKGRLAELIGQGTRYSIADTTKDDLGALVEQAIENDFTEADLANDIKASSLFSRTRAGLISDTETAMAQVFNHLEIWKRSGKVKSVNIVLSSDHAVDDECDEISGASPYPVHQCPEIPIHPNCRCSIIVHELV